MEQYIVFNKNYMTDNDGNPKYKKGVKYKIKKLENNFYYFMSDKIDLKYLNKLYTIGEIQTGYPIEMKGDRYV